ncbi:phycobilisome rod-core linker polypeptide [Synechococcus sp. AH-551-G03]|jgi:phycoerythrin-associated linker protein|nr:phycobilisome rod-core linker polypeptide [Synechococcus sp. AH-603-L18]MDA7435887.1 phycobilisome rod-core linker polypeptide [Synechococcus sp. AH-601-C19]MDB4337742.1 phycobilisome rod-core linker polypeptide [Synechococcus sp. AH-603-L18]MDC0319722.1 phycobilisome rod-core linker polypeptide [Synechococcus sp. AH-551-G03]|tara:strand:- start:2761 stop:3666 length:906 start_codon:yes stop_codon:yes gene_type:complete
MLSSTSVITSFGGEREAKPSTSYKSAQNKSSQSAALCNSEFKRRQCEGMKIAIGPRLHDQCERTVTFEEYPDMSSEALESALGSAYKHVYGNAHVMDNERSTSLEAQLKDGRISIQDFVRGLAKSDFYKKNFYDKCSPERTIELDFKHILGRTPHDQREITKYIEIQASKGHHAVIDSMVDSAEYSETFGRYTVPFMRSWLSQAGSAQSAFNRTAAVCLGYAYSDKAIGINSKLSQGLKTGQADRIVFPHASKLNFSGANLILKKGKPAAWIRKSATVLTIAGAIEVTRIILTIAFSAFAS